VYLEKPVAVDVPGALKVIDMGKRAQGKLSLDVGFQIRDCPPFVEMVKRIHGGALGKIICGESHYFAGYLDRPAWPDATPVERRLRNWVYDRALSGDINRGTKHSRDRYLQLGVEGPSAESFG